MHALMQTDSPQVLSGAVFPLGEGPVLALCRMKAASFFFVTVCRTFDDVNQTFLFCR